MTYKQSVEFAAVIFKISFLHITSHFFSTCKLVTFFKVCGLCFHVVIFHIQLLKLQFELRNGAFK